MPRYCGQCGKPLDGSAKFCGECGAPATALLDPYADGNTTPAEKDLWFKKKEYVPPDHTSAPQIKTVPTATGSDETVYVAPHSTAAMLKEAKHDGHLPSYRPPDHVSAIPVIKEQPKSEHPPGYWAPDHSSGIPVQKEQAPHVSAPGYKAPDHTSGIPVQKEKAPHSGTPGYKAPDHTAGIPVQKEQAPHAGTPGYKAPDHTSGIPVLKEQAKPVHAPGYVPPKDDAIPVIKEHAGAARQGPYVPPDHTKPVPQTKVVISLDGKEETKVVPAGTVEQPVAARSGLPRYVPPSDEVIPTVKEDPSKFKGYVEW